MSDGKEMKTLKDIIKATSDYGYQEAMNLSEDECKKNNLPTTGSGWNGTYSGEKIRIEIRQAAMEWIEELRDYRDNDTIDWIKKFFNLEDEE